jgi:hypothetical protein
MLEVMKGIEPLAVKVEIRYAQTTTMSETAESAISEKGSVRLQKFSTK